MAKRVGVLLVLTGVLMLLALGFHFGSFRTPLLSDTSRAFCRLGLVTTVAWSVSWYEPRLRGYHKAYYSPYPEFPPADRLGLIYRIPYAP
jgi:hypothetical protein